MENGGTPFAGQRIAQPALLVFALFLAISFPFQVKWFEGLTFHKQPGMWALFSVAGMVLTGAVLTARSLRESAATSEREELVFWLRACEFLVWFMAYVFIVPYLGYLPSTLLFTMALTWRLGYRRLRWLGISALLAISIVVLFRALLKVKVPGGKIYDAFPQPLSSFLLTYL